MCVSLLIELYEGVHEFRSGLLCKIAKHDIMYSLNEKKSISFIEFSLLIFFYQILISLQVLVGIKKLFLF